MMKRKGILISAIACLFVLAVGVGGSLAWLSDSDSATNEFTIGNVEIKVTETNWDKADGLNVTPGSVINKDPAVKNTGDNSCYVRMKVVANPAPDAADPYFSLNINTNNWKLIDDYYYYVGGTGILAPESSTSELFTKVTINKAILEPGYAAGFDINVYAEAIQSDNVKLNDIPGQTTAEKLAKLFEQYNGSAKDTIKAPVQP